MDDELRSMLLGTAGLGIAAMTALVLTATRQGIVGGRAALEAAVRLAVLAVVFQAAHFAEERATGFQRLFPGLLGLRPWTDGFFLWFNLFWLVVWILAIRALLARLRAALFPIWFLGITCTVNGLAHPLLAALTGSYFPGLVTSPFVGVAGVMLLRKLLLVTSRTATVRSH